MWRHGDVLIAPVGQLPPGARPRPGTILVRGEATGHAHRLEAPGTASLWDHDGTLYLEVTSPRARIVHEEHHPVELPTGVYRVWQQREYTPREIRTIRD